MADKLLRIRELEEFLGLGKHSSLLYKMRKDAAFPKPVYLSERTPAWWASEV